MYRKQLLTIWIRIHVPPDYKDRFQAWVKYGQHFRQTQRVIWRMLEAKTAWQFTYSFFFKNYPDTNILSMKSNFATNIIRHWSWAALCLLCFCDFLSVIEVAVEILTGEADATCMQYQVRVRDSRYLNTTHYSCVMRMGVFRAYRYCCLHSSGFSPPYIL